MGEFQNYATPSTAPYSKNTAEIEHDSICGNVKATKYDAVII